MEASTIRDKRFLETVRGYKKEDVDEFLREVAVEFSRLSKANGEYEGKLEVLANKIREYREDEDALKEALLGAQKQGRQVVEEAKEKAANIIADAQAKAEEMIREAEETAAQKREEGEKAIADALAEKQRIEEEAAQKAAELHTEMEIQNEIDKEILARTRREAEDFRTKLIVEYNEHIELIKNLPEAVQNEFVKETADNHDTAKLRGLLAQQKGEEVILPVEETIVEAAEKVEEDVKIVNDFSEVPVQEAESVEIEEEPEEEEDGGFTVENAFSDDEDDDNTPDFLKNKHKNNKSKFEKLEFGNNSSALGKNKKRR